MSGLKLFELGNLDITTGGTSTSLAGMNTIGVNEITNSDSVTINSGASIFLDTNGEERMVITPGGSIGIGTSTPETTLQIYSQNLIDDLNDLTNPFTTANYPMKSSMVLSGPNGSAATGGNVRTYFGHFFQGGADGGTFIQASNVGSGGNLDQIDELLLNPKGGHVGIGTSTPNVTLDVGGIIETKNSSGSVRGALNPGNGNFLTIECFNIGNTVKFPICLAPYGGNGQVTVNQANPTPSYNFSVNGTAACTSGTWSASDDRIKYNEEIISGASALAIVNQLEPQYYEKIIQTPNGVSGNWIPSDAEWPSVKDNYVWDNEAGLIAQDIRAIPGLSFSVSGQEVDAEGTQTPLHLNYNDIYAYHIAATKELSSQLTAEKAKLNNLETQVEEEKAKVTNLETQVEEEKAKVTALENQVLDLIIRVTQLENP